MTKRKGNGGGTIALVMGLLIFMFGILVAVGIPVSLRDALSVAFVDNTALDLFGLILMFGGGLIGIVGISRLVKSISNDISSNVSGTVYVQHDATMREIASLRSSVSDMVALMAQEAASRQAAPKRKCKFCDAEISENAAFCPVCNKSQL